MMKKVLFALAVLCTSFWSCNTLDLNDVGYGDGDRLKASSVKEILYGTADGCWKADYQGHEFYFQFHEDGTVTLDSDFLEMAVEGKTSFSAKGKEVALDIENCDVHLQNLGSEFADTKFVVSEIPAEGEAPQLNLYGESTGNTIGLHRHTSMVKLLQKRTLPNSLRKIYWIISPSVTLPAILSVIMAWY